MYRHKRPPRKFVRTKSFTYVIINIIILRYICVEGARPPPPAAARLYGYSNKLYYYYYYYYGALQTEIIVWIANPYG